MICMARLDPTSMPTAFKPVLACYVPKPYAEY